MQVWHTYRWPRNVGHRKAGRSVPMVCVAANTDTAVAPMRNVDRDVRATAIRLVVGDQEWEPSLPRRCSRSCGQTATRFTRTAPSSMLPRATLSSGPREPMLRSSGRSLPSLRMCNRKQLVILISICLPLNHMKTYRVSLESFVWSSTKCTCGRAHGQLKPLKFAFMSS